MRISKRLLACLLIGCGLVGANAQAQQGSGIRYRVTTRMEMVGMNFAMPAQTQEVCGPKNSAGESMVPKQDNCKVLDYKTSGNKSSFRMVCTGKDAMTGTGEFEMLGAAGYRGKMTVNADGQTMIMNFDGKRLGDCDYGREGPQAKANEMIGKTCSQIMAEPANALVGAYPQFAPGALCASQKAAYCRKISPLSSDLDFVRERDASDAQLRKQGVPAESMSTMWEAFQGCGLARTTVLGQDCAKAQKVGDYDFIGALCPTLLEGACERADPNKNSDFVIDRCPARANQIAAQQCAGRGYTALSSSPYRDFCNAYAGKRLQDRNGGGDNGSGQPSQQPPAKKPGLRDRLKGLTNGVLGGG